MICCAWVASSDGRRSAGQTDGAAPSKLHPACAASSQSKSPHSANRPRRRMVNPSLPWDAYPSQLDMRPHFTSHRAGGQWRVLAMTYLRLPVHFRPIPGRHMRVTLPNESSLRVFPKIGSRHGKFRPIQERYTVDSTPAATTCAGGGLDSSLPPSGLHGCGTDRRGGILRSKECSRTYAQGLAQRPVALSVVPRRNERRGRASKARRR